MSCIHTISFLCGVPKREYADISGNADNDRGLDQLACQLRAVANGPVGPAMAGPIIEAANFFFFFLIFLLYLFGRNNNRAGIFFDIIFETETSQSPKYAL